MDFVHKFLNFIAPPFTLFTVCLVLPPYLVFKFVVSILQAIFREDVAGKVVLITGASSGIGEQLAYEYAKRGACLTLSARRETKLRQVADRAIKLGSPDVIIVRADVSKVEDCKNVVDQTVIHFGTLDHLVNNAGITSVCMFEEITDVTNLRPIMDINFWGSVYTTYFAAPHLRKNNGKIIVLSSAAAYVPNARMSLYGASKAAMVSLYETLRVEFGSDIKIVIVTPGFIESEMTQGKFLSKEGKVEVDQDLRDAVIGFIPVMSVERCARKIVDSACRGDRYLTEPGWFRTLYTWRLFFPELFDWGNRLLFIGSLGKFSKDPASKKIIDIPGAKNILYPSAIQSRDVKIE